MIGVLLLVQWLTSAYACPPRIQPAPDRPVDAQVALEVMTNCHGATAAAMDPHSPSLCKAHCDADKQAPAAKAQGDVPSAALAWFCVAGPVPHDLLPPPAHAHGDVRCASPPGWPPLYLIHQVLRN